MMEIALDVSRWFLILTSLIGVVLYASRGRMVALFHFMAGMGVLFFVVYGFDTNVAPYAGILANVGTAGVFIWSMWRIK